MMHLITRRNLLKAIMKLLLSGLAHIQSGLKAYYLYVFIYYLLQEGSELNFKQQTRTNKLADCEEKMIIYI